MKVVYDTCCRNGAAGDPEVEVCPQCGTPLIRCATCGGLCGPDDFCARCHQLTALVEVGQKYRAGEQAATRLRLANQGAGVARVTRLRYGLSCADAYPCIKDTDRAVPPGEIAEFVLDGMAVEHAGLPALCLELRVEFGTSTFLLAGEKLLGRVEAPPQDRGNINIQVDHVDKAADLNINIGGSEPAGQAGAGMLEPIDLETRAGGTAVTRATRILVPCGERGEVRTFHLARKPTLVLGVARPEKYPQTDVCIRLYPEREGLNLECNQIMSRAHLELEVVNGTLCLTDRSTNGTTVNGARVVAGQPVPLKEGDVVAPWVEPRLLRHRRWRLRFTTTGPCVDTVEWIPLGGQ